MNSSQRAWNLVLAGAIGLNLILTASLAILYRQIAAKPAAQPRVHEGAIRTVASEIRVPAAPQPKPTARASRADIPFLDRDGHVLHVDDVVEIYVQDVRGRLAGRGPVKLTGAWLDGITPVVQVVSTLGRASPPFFVPAHHLRFHHAPPLN